ncbi:PREDICTED: uncharacterized protein LOC108772389 [Cyphomyrmex costatus]|uniref:uncharacterized protein LOC108772389 n=1 Tax=Cyphomyrmex costatus TaxID=456900 RepID=UPI000852209C|nr:PREDICTED: uncharacterized protein LOC108772389 [Cyphomyrmex costatus]
MTDWMTSTNWERNTMLKYARHGRNISFRCCMSAVGLIIFTVSLRLLKFFKTIHQPGRTLIYQLNIQKSPNYEITYLIQITGAICIILTNYMIDSFVSILVLHVCSQLTNLRTTLNNLVNELTDNSTFSTKKERFRKGLAAIVKRHKHLISLYVYCYSAEKLMDESTNMVYGVYECKWYGLPSKNAKDLMLIVHRSTIPLKLTAGKFGIFSLETFGIALKTAMAYLSALITLRG